MIKKEDFSSIQLFSDYKIPLLIQQGVCTII